jgi:hypothetical protein
VIEVHHPGSVYEEVKIRQTPVRDMLAKGMTALTGAPHETDAWRRFFEPSDAVGIKICPVGRIYAMSRYETVLEIVAALNRVGVKNKNIIVFDRYFEEFLEAGYHKILPDGVHMGWSSRTASGTQVETDGYDERYYADFKRVYPGQSLHNPLARRSHVCAIVSKRVNKVINVPCLKDHGSAGVTIALKNLSHGLTNNVSRTHMGPDGNWCDRFIPEVVAIPMIRQKAVLNVVDGLVGMYEGGPHGAMGKNPCIWPYRSMLFSTDPVAVDRIGWDIVDAKRVAMGFCPVGQAGKVNIDRFGTEGFNRRQPEHIFLAGRMLLGVADKKQITHEKIDIGSPA